MLYSVLIDRAYLIFSAKCARLKPTSLICLYNDIQRHNELRTARPCPILYVYIIQIRDDIYDLFTDFKMMYSEKRFDHE